MRLRWSSRATGAQTSRARTNCPPRPIGELDQTSRPRARSLWHLRAGRRNEPDEGVSTMAEGLNRVMLLGNLGADPELRVTPGGQAILKLRLATNETYLDKNNVRQERTEWHRVTVWGRRAEGLGKILKKGDTLFIEGRLQTSSYEKNGEKRYSTEVVANNVVLPGSGRGRGAARGEGGGARTGGEGGEREGGAPARPQRDAPEAALDDFDPGGPPGGNDDDIPF